MRLKLTRSIDSQDEVTNYYQVIHSAIGGNTNEGNLWLVKQEGWVTCVTYDGTFYEDESESRFIETLASSGYREFVGVSWSHIEQTPKALIVPSSHDGINEFRVNTFGWYVLFAGKPDWTILIANTLDFILLAGQPSFVRSILGCDPLEASESIQEMSRSVYLNPVVREYYSHILEQTQVVYPNAEPGAVVNLGLLKRTK